MKEKETKSKIKKFPQKEKTSEIQLQESVEKIGEQVAKTKQIPKEEQAKINQKVFENIVIADVFMLFLYFISLGSLNIESVTFTTDLKVFSIGILLFAIILFEISFKKENGNLAIHGIECLVLAIFTLFSISMYTLYLNNFHLVVASFSFLFAIYFVGKSIYLYWKMKKAYKEGLSDIGEIIKK